MPKSLASFITSLLPVFIGAFLVVMTTAFISIPQNLGGHPGEIVVAQSTSAAYHPT
jgi:hypothetical protein